MEQLLGKTKKTLCGWKIDKKEKVIVHTGCENQISIKEIMNLGIENKCPFCKNEIVILKPKEK